MRERVICSLFCKCVLVYLKQESRKKNKYVNRVRLLVCTRFVNVHKIVNLLLYSFIYNRNKNIFTLSV